MAAAIVDARRSHGYTLKKSRRSLWSGQELHHRIEVCYRTAKLNTNVAVTKG
jgi:hypothetical protein